MKHRSYEKAPLRFLSQDREVIDEIREQLQGWALEGIESASEQGLESVLALETVSSGTFSELEAIVLKTGRPSLLVKNGEYEEPSLETLRERLAPHKAEVLTAIASTARVELRNHPTYDYVGTAWMIADDVMITNRHVVDTFARRTPQGVVFRFNPGGQMLQAQVDFKEEFRSPDAFEVRIKEVLHLEDNADYLPDMALVRLEPNEELPAPLPLARKGPDFQEDVVVIGYPAEDSRNDYFVMHRIYQGIYKVKRIAPGKVSGVREDQFLFTHDCTTLGGNSGSVVIRLETGEALGLHYAGSYLENNYAVTTETILNRLASLGAGNLFDLGAVEVGSRAAEDLEARRPKLTVEDLADRKGYDSDFLREGVELPRIADDLRGMIAPVSGRQDGRLDYIHYSVVMHAERRMALYTACNIDGGSLFRPKRSRDQWYYDPRLGEDFQTGNDLYSKNKLQRGHLVRRLDPVWGETRKEAQAAQADTYFWTNCTPQHEGFNPRSWLELEDYVLENADNDDSKVTVFTGPIFRSTDKEYRGFRIPEDYWKVLAFHNDRTGALSATAYRLTQADLMNDLEFVYGEFQTFQVPVKEIEAATGLDFGELRERDPLGRIEFPTRIPIHSSSDLVL